MHRSPIDDRAYLQWWQRRVPKPKPRDIAMYGPLENNGIRLLFIKPAFHDEPIECALTTVDDIDDAPDFEAVSYLWGREMAPGPILCNGVEKTVTRNLEEALRALRPPPNWESVHTWPATHPLRSERHSWRGIARNRYENQEDTASLQTSVWIDALCINQEDVAERAQQVKLMGRIYQRASAVKIWLGKETRRRTEPPAAPAPAMTTLFRHYSLRQYGDMPVVLSFIAQALRNPQDEENPLLALRPTEDRRHRNDVHGLLPPSAAEWEVLHDFFANAYFKRVWIVQEVVVARHAVAILGDWHLDWAALGRAASWFARHGYALPRASRLVPTRQERNKDLVPAGEAAALWDTHQKPGKRAPLLGLLQEFRMRQAGQDADRLYATLGIAEETAGGLHGLLEPDYERPLLEVYRDAARYLIVRHGSLRVLCHVDHGPARASSWPSWIPDWRQAKGSSEIWDSEATEGLAADGNAPVAFGAVSHEHGLCLRGTEADRVQSYGSKLKSYGMGHVTYAEEQEFAQAAWKLTRGIPQDRGEEGQTRSKPDVLTAFVETLTAGTVGSPRSHGRSSNNNNTHPGAKPESSMADALNWLSQHLDEAGLTKWQPNWARRGDAGRFHEAFVRVCTDRRFFVTDQGRTGIGPEAMAEGDRVVILFGSRVPFVLRAVGPRYKLVGECYVAGLMDGQAVAQAGDLGEIGAEFELE